MFDLFCEVLNLGVEVDCGPAGGFRNCGLSNSVGAGKLWGLIRMIVLCCYPPTIGMCEGLVVGRLTPVLNWHVYPYVAAASGDPFWSVLASRRRGRRGSGC